MGQAPRCAIARLGEGPAGLQSETAPGGISVFSASPIPDGLKLKVKGTAGSQQIRIGLTDIAHKSLGYTLASPARS